MPDLGTYPMVFNPIVDGAFLPKTIVDRAVALTSSLERH
jgi:hypothetical protein